MKDGAPGFALLTAAMASLLMAFLSLLLSLQLAQHWELAAKVDSQLYSLVLAENGLAFARSRLAGASLDDLLNGSDHLHCGDGLPEWRNPMPFEEALSVDPASWVPGCDDGLIFQDGPPWGHSAAGSGYYFVKISNNPEESPEEDLDHEVLIRSLGIVPNRNSLAPQGKALNSTVLLEARVRQERVFLLPSPLTLFADSGVFLWEGDQFLIEAGQGAAVSVIGLPGSTLLSDLSRSLSPSQRPLLRGSEAPPSIQDATPLYRASPDLMRLFSSEFWRHLLARLPEFSASRPNSVRFLPNGGVLNSHFSGTLIAQGNVRLQPGARIQGLLLHLGQGNLFLSAGSQVSGAVWMSNLDLDSEPVTPGVVSLHGSGRFHIRYDPQAVREALALLPTTLLGWRILFPETVR